MSKLNLMLCLLVAHLAAAGEAATLESGANELTSEGQQIEVRHDDTVLLRISAIEFNYTPALEWTVLDRSTDALVLEGRFPASVDYEKAATDTEPRFATLMITRRPSGFRLQASPDWATHVTLYFDYLGDRFFGLSEPLQPDNRLSPDLTGATIRVEIESEGDAFRENYASAMSAFYMSSRGFGAFFDTFARGQYAFAVNGRNRIHHDTGKLDWYVFIGDDGRAIHAAYFDVIGVPKPVPPWALGPIGWRDQNDGGADEILADIGRMTDLGIPFTAWFVDRPYSDGAHSWSRMNFGPAFRDPRRWIGTIREQFGLEFMTWVSPATFGDARFGKHLAGQHSYIDLSHADSVAAYQQTLQDEQYAYGVRGHKVDRADERFPVYEPWHDESVPVAERRNRYPYLLARVQDEALRAAWGDDQFTFARAAFHRTQPFLSAIWAGDPRSSWDGFRGNFGNAARSAFLGFPVWGSDVGGYLGDGHIPPELYVRWLQAGSMSGLFEIKLDGAGGAGEDRMPWRYDDDFQAIFRAICEDRMRLIPYLYSLTRTSAETGTLMQPLAYRHFRDPNAWDVWDEFYVGDAILVAPVFEPGSTRSVYLPEGRWREFDDPATVYSGGQRIDVDAPLDRLPRFVRDNSVFVTGNVYRGNDRNWRQDDATITVHVFPGADGTITAFDYVDLQTEGAIRPIAVAREHGEIRVTAPALGTAAVIAVRLDEAPESVVLNGEPAQGEFDAAARILTTRVEPGSPIDLRVEVQAE